jgi:hypothetical protein
MGRVGEPTDVFAARAQVWDWDDQQYTGSIPEANYTYNSVSNVNQWGGECCVS